MINRDDFGLVPFRLDEMIAGRHQTQIGTRQGDIGRSENERLLGRSKINAVDHQLDTGGRHENTSIALDQKCGIRRVRQ